MTACDRPVEPLLTAALDELAGTADTELSRHVRDCPHCAAAARKILAANDALDASLREGFVLHRASLLARAPSKEPTPGASRRRWRAPWPANRPALGWVAAAVGLVAVATVIVVVTPRQEPLPSPRLAAEPPATEQASQPLTVDAPGYDVAVIPTENPDVTIIWFAKETDDADVVDGPIAVDPTSGL
ncbi:MAG: hypothetical protein OXI79_18870 [Gammaproteobacteria bacterium]|nr:hypothetical protein [Gammaproteobacteria bacterium]